MSSLLAGQNAIPFLLANGSAALDLPKSFSLLPSLSLGVVDVAQREHREQAEDDDRHEHVAEVGPAVVVVVLERRLGCTP